MELQRDTLASQHMTKLALIVHWLGMWEKWMVTNPAAGARVLSLTVGLLAEVYAGMSLLEEMFQQAESRTLH